MAGSRQRAVLGRLRHHARLVELEAKAIMP